MKFLYKNLAFLGFFVGICSSNVQAASAKPDLKSASAISLRELGKRPVLQQQLSFPAIKRMESHKLQELLKLAEQAERSHDAKAAVRLYKAADRKGSPDAKMRMLAAKSLARTSSPEDEKVKELIANGAECIVKNDEKGADLYLKAAASLKNSSISVLYKEAIKPLEDKALAGDLNVCKRLIEVYTDGFGAIKSEIGNALRFKLLIEKGRAAVSQNQDADQVDELNDEDLATVLQRYYPDESDDQ